MSGFASDADIDHIPVADPGFVKREGRESKCHEKAAQRGGGGLRHIFVLILFCVFCVIYIMG